MGRRSMEGHQPLDAITLTIRPANDVSADDLRAVFGTRDSGQCNCQRYKTRGWFWEQATDDQRRARLLEQANCGDPAATSTTGLVAFLDDPEPTPVGWVAVEPRTEYPRLVGLPTVWKGRPDEDKSDDSVWAVTCFVVRKGYRRRGVTYALAAAAVGYAKANGARALEGYAMLTQPGREITWGELHVGARQVFAEAGLTDVSRPSVRRAVMRIDFDPTTAPTSTMPAPPSER
ncbi:MAG TPA: GNAT family N-acetyltransferase [Trebonia sp.]|nr:GNAT family N-acetyltransferase [Trebonia sp.]